MKVRPDLLWSTKAADINIFQQSKMPLSGTKFQKGFFEDEWFGIDPILD